MTEADPIIRLNELRQKVMNEEELTTKETEEVISLLRAQRSSQLAQTVARDKKTAEVAQIDLNKLFD